MPGCSPEARREPRRPGSHTWYPARSGLRSTGKRGWGGVGEWRAGRRLECGKLDWTEPGRNSGEQGSGAADRCRCCKRWFVGSVSGRAQACSPVFAILDGGLAKAGPLQKWGIPASICAGGEDAVLWGIENKAGSQKARVFCRQDQSTCFPSTSHQEQARVGEKRLCFSFGAEALYPVCKSGPGGKVT